MFNKKKTMKHKNILIKKKKKSKQFTFSSEDYKDDSGFQTSIWGPSTWLFLHTISFNYPLHPTKEQKKYYKDFIYSLRNILPCKYCRQNLTKNLKQRPLLEKDLKDRESFSRYIYNLHNTVNRLLHKKVNISYEEVRDKYENFRAKCSSSSNSRNNNTQKRKSSHKNTCEVPYHGVKSKCVLRIVPKDKKTETLKINKKCFYKKVVKHNKTKKK